MHQHEPRLSYHRRKTSKKIEILLNDELQIRSISVTSVINLYVVAGGREGERWRALSSGKTCFFPLGKLRLLDNTRTSISGGEETITVTKRKAQIIQAICEIETKNLNARNEGGQFGTYVTVCAVACK